VGRGEVEPRIFFLIHPQALPDDSINKFFFYKTHVIAKKSERFSQKMYLKIPHFKP
jgi:hypothetical protein